MKEKQIDNIGQMARVMCGKDKDCLVCPIQSPCLMRNCAELLNAEGYRKASDVAREIFDEFHNMLLKFVSDFDDGLEKANDKATTVVLDCARETILLVILYLAGLKKKYIGKDTNVTTKESEKDK